MSDDQLEKWIIQRDRKDEVRSRIIPASAERLASENPGDGEAAMDSIAAWLGNHKQLPLVELGRISPSAVTLTFSEDAVLPEPWVSPTGDRYTAHDQWGITLQNAIELPRGDNYGWQISGLTGLGTLADGSRGLFNTCRWEILQIAGTPEWTRTLMLTQVMNQAAEPWSADHDIWLIGFGETAEKLMSFLAKEHPRHRFHVADSLKEVQETDLHDTTATLYVMGADRDTELQFQALQTSGVGLMTDAIVTDEAMFLSERDSGLAVLGPFRQDLEIWPNLSASLIEKMEQAWLATEELAKQKAAETDFNAFFAQQPDEHEEQSHDDTDADLVDEILTQENAVSTDAVSEDHEAEATQSAQGQVTESKDNDDEVPEETGQPDTETIGPPSQPVMLQLMGKTAVQTPEGELTGRHAALLAILKISQEPVPPQQISEMLWPGDETQGQTARTRRSRLLSKIRQHAGDIVQIDDEGWVLRDGELTSDFDLLRHTLAETPLTESEVLMRTCQKVVVPLQSAEDWAGSYRATMTGQLNKLLTNLKDRAVEAEEYDIAKAAKTALRQLGEG